MGASTDEQECTLCGRVVPKRIITLHHLKPRQKGGTAEERTPLCKPCHKQVHAVFTNTELAQRFHTLPLIRDAEKMQPFLKWIRKQKTDRDFRTVDVKSRSGRRRKRRF